MVWECGDRAKGKNAEDSRERSGHYKCVDIDGSQQLFKRHQLSHLEE